MAHTLIPRVQIKVTPEVRPPGHGIRIPWKWHSVDPSLGARVSLSGFSYTTQLGDHVPGLSAARNRCDRVWRARCEHPPRTRGSGICGCVCPHQKDWRCTQ